MKTLYTPCTQKCFRWQRENKQTNMQFRVWELALRILHLYLQPVKAVRLLPMTRTLPRPCCWNKAPTVCACSGESAWDNVRPPPPWLRLRPFGQAEVRRECGGLGIYRGRNDGWGVCGNLPPARLSTCEKGQCAAHLQCRSPALRAHFGKRHINGWHKAGLC